MDQDKITLSYLTYLNLPEKTFALNSFTLREKVKKSRKHLGFFMIVFNFYPKVESAGITVESIYWTWIVKLDFLDSTLKSWGGIEFFQRYNIVIMYNIVWSFWNFATNHNNVEKKATSSNRSFLQKRISLKRQQLELINHSLKKSR